MNNEAQPPEPAVVLDTGRASPARAYDFLLGGKDNYEADREAARAMIAQIPSAPMMARANRAFLRRAVGHLVELGVTQFLDVGSGIPTACNTHQIAQHHNPAARVVYVDNDPMVAVHSQALLRSGPAGATGFLVGDATRPDRILADPALTATLDLSRPVGLMLVSVLMYFDDDTVAEIVSTLLDGLPAGSYLALSHPTADFGPAAVARAVAAAAGAGLTYIPRPRRAIKAMVAGLELVEPGVVPMLAWRPERHDVGETRDPSSVYYWVAMARKP